jgi:hypothetical protein
VTIENNVTLRKEVNKNTETPLVHYFFVSNRGGVCLYCRNYTDEYQMDEQLISAFCSALISFSKEVINKRIKKINMSPLEIVIIQRYNLFYGFLTNALHNTLILEDYIDKIDNRLGKYIRENNIDVDVENISDEALNRYIDEILTQNTPGSSNSLEKNKEREIKDLLKTFMFRNDVKGLILFDNKGTIKYSSLTPDRLEYILEDIDFRVKIINKAILKLFYTTERELIFSRFINKQYYLVVIFDIHTPFGIAEYLLNRVIKEINELQDS